MVQATTKMSSKDRQQWSQVTTKMVLRIDNNGPSDNQNGSKDRQQWSKRQPK
jgi:hypothetical protein